MKASVRYGKNVAFVLAFLLVLFMVIPSNMAYAVTKYTATGSETAAELTAIIDGTTTDAGGNKYDVIEFPAGNYNYTMTAPVHIRRTVTIKADAGANVVFNGGDFRGYAGSNTTFTGDGSFLLKKPINYGIWSNDASVKFNFDHANFTIDGAPGFGLYGLLGGNTTNVKGGTFVIKNYSTSGNEGGFELDGGAFNVSDGAKVTLENNGNGTFGDLYMNGKMTVTGANTKVTINESRAGNSYGMVLAGIGTLKIDGATVEVNTTTASRGINAGNNATNTIDIVKGGKLLVKAKGGTAVSGIRRSKISASDDSILKVEGYKYALDGSMLSTSGKPHVTLDGETSDNGSIPFFTGGTNGSIIMGGSVLEDYKEHVVDGVVTPTAGGNQVAKQPENAKGELLTRFDIKGFSNKSISIAADPANAAHSAYTYNVGENHNGVAYVWAPAVKVNFWETKEALDNNDNSKMIKSLTTIRGNNLKLVGAVAPSEPAAPTGKVFSHWVDAETGQAFDVNTALVKGETNVYPEYKEAPPQTPSKKVDKKVVKVKKSPKTGDVQRVAFYAGVLIVTIIALVSVVRLKRRA